MLLTIKNADAILQLQSKRGQQTKRFLNKEKMPTAAVGLKGNKPFLESET